MAFDKGILEVICGSMFSGKTQELIRRIDRALIAKQKVQVFKHVIDKRSHDASDPEHWLTSRTGSKIQAVAVSEPGEIIRHVNSYDINVIGIDELHFFPIEIVNTLVELLDKKKRIIAAGLDLDFTGRPFPGVANAMAIADEVLKLKAICQKCQSDTFCLTQRIIDGKPAKYDDPIILVGSEECYLARCRKCHIIDKKGSIE